MPRTRAGFALVAAVSLLLVPRPGAAAPSSWVSRPWLMLSAGYENDRLPDPVLDRFALPGGSLLGLTPGIWISGRPGARSRLDLSGRLAYERFQNGADRSVLGGVASGELRALVASSWLWRLTAAGNYYSDSAYEVADRVGGGVETGFGVVRSRWSLEAFGGADGRRYRNLDAYDDRGLLGTYTETGRSLGLGGSARVGAGTVLAGRATWLRTDARDRLYDADSWLARATMRTGLPTSLVLTLSALGERRVFDSRPAPQDVATYWQVGVGLERALTATVGLAAHYAFARNADPSYADQNLHRFTLAATWGLGGSAPVAVGSDLRLPADPQAARLRENEARVFRFRAPSARAVSLVADFNGWDPAASPLHPEEDGWWRTEIRLPAGSHQYAYLVDGAVMAPADAEAMVDDGFGGRNGLIWVAPGGP